MKSLIVSLILLLFPVSLFCQMNLRIFDIPGGKILQLTEGDVVCLQTPVEGFWSIGTDWDNHWISGIQYGQPNSIEKVNGYQILKGDLILPDGIMHIRDAYKPENGRIRCTRRWEWDGKDTLKRATLMIRFESRGLSKDVVMPGILYHGNPSGERSGNTPYFHGEAGELALFEEHRFPMPFVSRECLIDGRLKGMAIHSLPSPVPFGNHPDQWWSMGVINHNEYTEMVIFSGPVGFNNKLSVIKAFQGGPDMMEPYDNAWMDIPPHSIIEKTFWLETYPVERSGAGFQIPVQTSLDLFKPWYSEDLPSFKEIVSEKLTFAKSRYYEKNEIAGFKKYPDRNFFVLGWCGQSAACGYAMQVLQNQFPIDQGNRMIQHSLDFLSESGFYESGFYTWYDIDKQNWFMNHTPEWLSQGQSMLNFANAIRVARAKKSGKQGELETGRWEAFLEKASDFHAKRILSADWKPESTNEAFFIAPLCEAYTLFNRQLYLDAATKAAKYYADRSLQMKEPYWGGTLDASCEDKEGAFAALQGFIAIYEVTKNPEYLKWAKHAGDVAMTYTVVWDIPMPPGRLTDHAFKSRGWTAVSVQNMHIDVYGVLIAPSLYKLGQLTGLEAYCKTAKVMFRTCGQLIDPYGSQGEQPYHTNYIQTSWRDKPVYERRGNYLESWTVFWITAHFLNAAAMFTEMGVEWER